MKNTLINFKAEASKAEAWKKAAKQDGKTVSEVCRAALDRMASRVERKTGKSNGED